MLCPSDSRGAKIQIASGLYHARGNYAVFFGNLNKGATRLLSTGHQPAAFGYRPVNLGAILDGTSNSMAFGEMLREATTNTPFRGCYWRDFPGASWIFTLNTPNSPVPDNIRATQCPASANLPLLNMPCVPIDGNNESAASRSRHPGGVQVALCDGSVRFVAQTIGLAVWRAAGSIEGKSPINCRRSWLKPELCCIPRSQTASPAPAQVSPNASTTRGRQRLQENRKSLLPDRSAGSSRSSREARRLPRLKSPQVIGESVAVHRWAALPIAPPGRVRARHRTKV